MKTVTNRLNRLGNHKVKTLMPTDCPECGKEFESRQGAARHMRAVHGMEMPEPTRDQLSCPLCEFVATKIQGIHRHVHQSHPGNKKWRVGDPINGSRSNGASPVPKRIGRPPKTSVTPTGVVVWKSEKTKCPECPQRGFSTARAFGAHRRVKHGVPGTSAAALYQQQLKRDRMSEHGVKVRADGQLECPECHLPFVNASSLGVHRKFKHNVEGHHSSSKRAGGRSGSNSKARREKIERNGSMPHHQISAREIAEVAQSNRCHFCPKCGLDILLIEKAISLQQ